MKELKEEILQAVNDATDLTDNTVSMPILSHFLDNILSKQLTLTDVVSTCCSNKHVVSDCDTEWCKNCGHKYN